MVKPPIVSYYVTLHRINDISITFARTTIPIVSVVAFTLKWSFCVNASRMLTAVILVSLTLVKIFEG